MENSFQTSFIPKKPVDNTVNRRRSVDIFTVLSILILVITVIITGLLYVYKIYLEKQKESIIISLEKSRDSFEQETIEKLESFNKKTIAVNGILNNHKVLSPLFSTLEEITIPAIQYIKFDHKYNGSNLVVNLEGVAKDYKSIAQQSDIFNSTKGRFFNSIIFSDLTKDTTSGLIKFKLEFNVDPSLLSYEKNLMINNNLKEVNPN